MFTKPILTAVTAAAVAMPVPAMAGSNDFAAGLVGGIIGGALVNSQRQQPRTTTRSTTVRRSTSSRSGISSTERAQNREVQTALNYFGFNAGTPDGVLGRKSRTAVSGMQAFLSLPVDGTLSSFERDILLGAHARALSGNPETMRLVSTSPLGARAALQAQHAMMTGGGAPAQRMTGYPGLPLEVSRAVDEIAASSDPSAEQLLQRAGFVQLADLNGDGNNDYILDTSVSGSSFWCSAAQCKALVFVSTPDGYARNDMLAHGPTAASFECMGASCRLADDGDPVMAAAPEPAAPDATVEVASPALPVFGAAPAATLSLASHCGKVNLLTATRGGFIDAAAGGEPEVALAEQFCLARNFAVDAGEQIMTGMPGVTMQSVQAQCAAFGPTMAAQIGALSTAPRPAVMQEVAGFVLGTGMSQEQLRTTATLCLAAGYAADDLDVALGAALLMVALGSAPHAELLGHHLQSGFGTAERPDLAAAWYGTAIEALKGGTTPVFAPNQAGRTELLTWAASGVGQGAAAAQPVPAALPNFGTAATD
ncbi:peptidoglycan-binding domain-containing protein [Jannaschia ovalis]|uniref:Peptidoglycan-binding domain-containing protein n=1 Tax=Jannaschia ovalis TaxID=3038773 RepID=A0ABY8LC23_9RHOB|nr:peptidoglycan-binding domain-containing protein [Jannaschia sp. GRR-S6-38]WGH78880.1 peptidoglycan-binding domain-containing protein [Jannaschia sp. GRR-S6-38]